MANPAWTSRLSRKNLQLIFGFIGILAAFLLMPPAAVVVLWLLLGGLIGSGVGYVIALFLALPGTANGSDSSIAVGYSERRDGDGANDTSDSSSSDGGGGDGGGGGGD